MIISSPGMARNQRGAATVELTLLVPALLLVVGLLVAGGRLWFARTTVNEAAQTAARAASLSRSAYAAASADVSGNAPMIFDLGLGRITETATAPLERVTQP